MYPILRKNKIAPGINRLEVLAPEIAQKAKAGQFVIVRIDDQGERIPLTIHDFDPRQGSIAIIVQEVGLTTGILACMKAGDSLKDVAGPLGVPTEIKYYGKVIIIGGGVGTAPAYPIARALKEAGNQVVAILGARTADAVILRDKMNEVAGKVQICTDDGSLGIRGVVTELLRAEVDDAQPEVVFAIGPLGMMKAVAEVTREHKIKTIVSLNPIMVDGTGMCGACRVRVGEELKFACVEGPEFDGHQVDWSTLMRRANMYRAEEQIARKHDSCSGGGCSCR